MSSSGVEGIKLPGFGLPVNAVPEDRYTPPRLCFPNVITSWVADNIVVREQIMLGMINEITEKPEWDRKVNDEAIVEKWREALGDDSDEGMKFSDSMFDYCIAELRDKAAHFAQTGRVTVLDSEAAVVKSDTAIPTELAEELKAAVRPLEDVPRNHKDWHPGSNEKVLNLVHPSLYPLMYGKSRVIPSGQLSLSECIERCGEGVIIPKPKEEEVALRGHGSRDVKVGYWSDSYQWLPSEVEFRGEDEVEITSYINNLHPRNKALYSVLEKIIAKTTPLWGECLSYLDYKGAHVRVPPGDRAEYEYSLGKQRPHEEGEDSDDDDVLERDQGWLRANRVLIQPEPREYTPLPREKLTRIDLRKDWRDKGLQIIVKLANIELRPEDGKTSYGGGTWHVEGQLNEHICASAISSRFLRIVRTGIPVPTKKSSTLCTHPSIH